MYCRVEYTDVFFAAASTVGKRIRRGLTRSDMLRIAAKLGRRIAPVNHRRVDVDDDVGVLALNWNQVMAKHWVVLRCGTIIDPDGGEVWDADEYLRHHDCRVGTLLVEK
jgi:hypothetical protein